MYAHQMFNNIDSPDLVSFTSIITGCAQSGFGKKALELFKKIKDETDEPMRLAILVCFWHAPMWISLKKDGLISTQWNHHLELTRGRPLCLFELLSRARLLDDAIWYGFDMVDTKGVPFGNFRSTPHCERIH